MGLTLARDGSIREVSVVPSRVVASHALTYEQADSLLALPAPADNTAAAKGDAAVASDLRLLRALADARRAYREARGCIEIPLPEVKVRSLLLFLPQHTGP